MLLAIYTYEGFIRYKRLNDRQHLNNWLNKYFNHVELIFLTERDFWGKVVMKDIILPIDFQVAVHEC